MSSTAATPAVEPQASPFGFASTLLRHWRILILSPIVTAAVTALAIAASEPTYTARASFAPAFEQSTQSQISTLAAQFGVNVGSGGSVVQSPSFYRTVLRSDELLRTIAASEYTLDPDRKNSATPLAELLEVDEEIGAREVSKTVETLKELTTVSVDRETGVVAIAVQTHWPALSLQIAQDMIRYANDFNLRKRQEQAAAEQSFTEERVAQAAQQLRQSENELQSFLMRNRQFQGDPQLTFAFDRLQRNVQMNQGIYSTLAQAYAQASLNVLRNTPLVTLVQPPFVDPIPDDEGIISKLLLAMLLGIVAAVAVAVLIDFVRDAAKAQPIEYQQFVSLRRSVVNEIRRAGARKRMKVSDQAR